MIQATYFYFGLTTEQTDALKSALSTFNNGGKAFSFKVGDETVYVQFSLTATEAADGDAAKEASDGAKVELANGSYAFYGNVVSTVDNLKSAGLVNNNNSGSDGEFAFALQSRVKAINEKNTRENIAQHPGENNVNVPYSNVLSSALTHEIGHNLAAAHGDPGNLMSKIHTDVISSNDVGGGPTGIYRWSYPGIDNNSVRALSGRVGMPYGSTNSNYINSKESERTKKAENPGTAGKLLKL